MADGEREDLTFPTGDGACAAWMYRPAGVDAAVPLVQHEGHGPLTTLLRYPLCRLHRLVLFRRRYEQHDISGMHQGCRQFTVLPHYTVNVRSVNEHLVE